MYSYHIPTVASVHTTRQTVSSLYRSKPITTLNRLYCRISHSLSHSTLTHLETDLASRNRHYPPSSSSRTQNAIPQTRRSLVKTEQSRTDKTSTHERARSTPLHYANLLY